MNQVKILTLKVLKPLKKKKKHMAEAAEFAKRVNPDEMANMRNLIKSLNSQYDDVSWLEYVFKFCRHEF